MSDKIVKIKKKEDVNEQVTKDIASDIDDLLSGKDVLERLSTGVASHCSYLAIIKESEKKILDFLGKKCGLNVRVYSVTIPHAPHIQRHASMGVIPTIGNDEYAELLFPGIVEELAKTGVTIEQSPVVMETIVVLRSMINTVANLVIQTATLRNPEIHQKCFEISVMPDKTVPAMDDSGMDTSAEWMYCRESEIEILKMAEAVIKKEDILYLFDNFLF